MDLEHFGSVGLLDNQINKNLFDKTKNKRSQTIAHKPDDYQSIIPTAIDLGGGSMITKIKQTHEAWYSQEIKIQEKKIQSEYINNPSPDRELSRKYQQIKELNIVPQYNTSISNIQILENTSNFTPKSQEGLIEMINNYTKNTKMQPKITEAELSFVKDRPLINHFINLFSIYEYFYNLCNIKHLEGAQLPQKNIKRIIGAYSPNHLNILNQFRAILQKDNEYLASKDHPIESVVKEKQKIVVPAIIKKPPVRPLRYNGSYIDASSYDPIIPNHNKLIKNPTTPQE